MAFPTGEPLPRQPILNVPPVILILAGIMVAVFVLQEYVLSVVQSVWVTVNFAFIPGRPDQLSGLPVDILPGANVWSAVTYAFLHADWAHLGINVIALLAFGSPLAWRFGWGRFLLFSAVAAVAGALANLLVPGNQYATLVGASAAISAHMAGASRFLFIGQGRGARNYFAPAAPLRVVLTDPRTMTFLGAWFAINIVTGLLGVGAGEGVEIAWEAHIGGFLVGLLLFGVFDPPVWPNRVVTEDEEPAAPA